MPLHKHEPCPIELMNYVSPYNTICEVIRTIYWEAERIGCEDIQLQCRIAITMAKAMNSKLKEHNKGWSADFYDANPNEQAKDMIRRKREARHAEH